LVLETPNPENLSVSTLGFWGDPTHLRPLPKDLVSFICTFVGFEDVEHYYLQESQELKESAFASLYQVFVGSSPDYGILARKPVEGSLRQKITFSAINMPGITLRELADRYDWNIQSSNAKLEKDMSDVKLELKVILDSKFWKLYSGMADAKARLISLSKKFRK
jgi:hypothetical protein